MLRSRYIRTAAYAAGGLFALIGLSLALLHTPAARQYAMGQARRLLHDQGIDFDASGFDYNLFTLRFELRKVRVQSRQTPDLPPLLVADRVQVAFNLRKLIAGAYHVDDAAISNPQVHLVIDGLRDNIPKLPKSDNTKPVDYLVRHLSITGGWLRVENRQQQLTANLPLETLTVEGNPLSRDHRISLRAGTTGSIALAGRSLPLRGLSANVLMGQNSARVDSFQAQLDDSTLSASGAVESLDSPSFNLRGESTFALAPLIEFTGLAQTVRGILQVSWTANGPLPALKVAADIRGNNLTVDRFDHIDLNTVLAYDSSSARVRADSLHATSPWGTVRGSADVALTETGESAARFDAANVDLSRIPGLQPRIASTAAARIDARWPSLHFDRAAGDGTVRLSAKRGTPAKDVVPVEGFLRFSARGNRINVDVQDLRALGGHAAGEVVLLDRNSLRGELRVDAPSLSSSVAAAEAFLGRPAGSLAGVPIEGSLRSTTVLSGTVTAPRAAVQLAIDDATAGTLRGLTVHAAIHYVPEQLDIRDASIDWQNQSVHLAGTVGLGSAQPLKMTAKGSQISVAAILAGLNQASVPVTGSLSLDAGVTGTVEAPQASIELTANDIHAYGEPFGELKLHAAFREKQVEITSVQLDKPQPGGNGVLTATGSYQLDSERYRFALRARDLRLLSLALPDGTPVRGSLNLEASGEGTPSAPGGNLTLDASSVQYGEQDFGPLKATLRAANDNVEFAASASKYHLNATARAGTRAPYPTTAQLHVSGLSLAELPSTVEGLEGTLSADIDAAGNLENYRQGSAKVQVTSANLKFKGEPVRTEGPLELRYANGTLAIDRAEIVARTSRIEAGGSLPVEASAPPGDIRLAARLNLSDLAHFGLTGSDMQPQGTASLDGHLRGTLARIEPEFTVSLENGSMLLPQMGPAITNVTLQAQVRNGSLEIETAAAQWGEASFTAAGIVPFALLPASLPVELPRRQGPAKFTADLKGVNLAAIQGMPPKVSGAAGVHIEAEASSPDLDAVKASITFPVLRAVLDTFTVAQDGTSELTLEKGVLRVQRLRMTGPSTEFQLSGTAGLAGQQPLDLHLDGKLDAAIAAAFSENLRVRGATEVHAAVSGSVSQPQAKGFLQVTDGQFSMDDPRMAADGLNLRVDLDGLRATVSQLEGHLNGGTLSGRGSVGFKDGKPSDADLTLQVGELYMDFPAGLKTISDVRLQLKSVGETLALRGSVLIKEGGFTDDLNFDRGILAAATAPATLGLTQERNALVDSLRLNVGIVTQDPIVVENNLAKAQITAQLVLLGSPYEPGLAGRLVIDEGSELKLQERHYEVSRGLITFTNERRIEPTLDIEATTKAADYDISLRISGPPGDTKTELSSTPPLPEPEILALLVTGKTLDEIRGQEFQLVQTQVLSYLTGRLGSTIGRELERATGLSRVRVEPNLIAAETNPGARLTVGQDITRQLQLVYSMDLFNSGDQIYIAEYDLTRRFVTRGVRQSDGSFRFDFRHDLRFGGLAPPQRATKRDTRRIGQITVAGAGLFSESLILKKLDVKTGQTYDFFKVRRGVDRVTRLYTDRNLLESNIRLRRETKDSTVNLNLQIDQGPGLIFVFEGASVPGGVEKELRHVWAAGVFDTQRIAEATGVLRAWLIGDEYLTPEITTAVTTPSPDKKRVLFEITRGPKYVDVEWIFEGASGSNPKRLRAAVESQKLSVDVYTKPSRVTVLLTEYYHEMGYLDATVSDPRYEFDRQNRKGRVVFPVKEGPLCVVGTARFQGNRVLSEAELAAVLPLPQGETYRPVLRENSLQRVRELYWTRGYNDVAIDVELERETGHPPVNLVFHITENARGIVQDVTIEGNRSTSTNLIRSQLGMSAGDPVNLQKIGESRRKLYNTGAFSLVEITREEMTPKDGGGDIPVRLRVKVQEVRPFLLRYGGFYDTERGPGGIVDFSNRNSLGSARVLGFRGRYDSQLQEARGYFSQPLLIRFPVKSTASVYARREIHPETTDASGFNVDRLGFSMQQEVAIGRRMLFNYGYKLESSRTYDTGPDPFFDVPLRIAALTSTFSRETRDDLLDASRGSFFSHAIQFSPESLGSQVRFIKYFGQYFHYFPLQKPRVELFTNQILRPRLVFGTGVRIGLSRGLGGQEVPLSERFFAGGSTTIRGFAQDAVGPVTSAGLHLGGSGLLVLNNELRFPLIGIVDGVGFVDLGNVYSKVSDFSLTDIRKAAGAGLRIRTPWLLIRLDYGFKLDRKPGEPVGRFFFGIGQAF